MHEIKHNYPPISSFSALQVGDGGTSGTLSGAIENNGFLNFNRSDTYTVSNTFTGAGILGFSGGGTAIFSSTFNGAVAVAESGLVLDGSGLVGASVFVGANGVLSGNGAVGSLTVLDGGVVAPGNSPGTISVAGTLGFEAGSVYRVDVTPDGAHDLITATGAVTINAGAAVEVIAVPGRYAANTTYAIVTTTDTLTGAFGSITSDYAFLSPSLSYDAQNAYLTLLYTGTSFASLAQTPNQTATANGAQALGFGNGVFDAVVQLSQSSVPGALNALSGEAYASVGTLMQQQSVYVREAVGTRLRQSLTAPGAAPLGYAAGGPQTAALGAGLTPTLWAQGYGGWGDSFSNGNAASISNSIGGFLMGLDVALAPNVRAGLFGGFSQSQFEVT
ncbi:MAG: autotransporter outer membrane beta-barrel domain-containing protein, partial [Azorhizobium sp. 39-67-5]